MTTTERHALLKALIDIQEAANGDSFKSPAERLHDIRKIADAAVYEAVARKALRRPRKTKAA